MDAPTPVEHKERETYLARTPASAALFARAAAVLPGGDTRTGTFHAPYPLFVAEGDGCWLTDADGRRYLDTLYNFTSLLHGHAFPPIVDAIRAQAARGTVHGTANARQVELAEVLRARVPSVERLRFCNSGTEATLGAIRAARAFTKKPAILKMAGGYHGSHDPVAIAMSAAPSDLPPGITPGVAADVLIGAFNDLDRTATLIRRHRDHLAAVIVEPMLGSGALIADRTFLEGLRAVTTECGVLLILDEVITFRLGVGGLQEVLGVRPDLTSFGKIMGGGLPVGAFGGRADVMATYDPSRAGSISHSGTYNGNAATMAAGLAALAHFDAAAVAALNVTGDRLRARLNEVIAGEDIEAVVTGHGSLMQLHLTAPPVTTPEAALAADVRFVKLMHLALANRGVFSSTRQLYVVATVMRDAEMDHFAGAFAEALGAVARARRAASPVL
ncbi:MAG: aminotransferase class III-fold pyridoxal phosphate-dependent enzyme [Acidobacteria bacterium]|nr:aminotransferase class III-fold pyridoxal phosphate-dependent enzyme [Acidobacteriota bacterium]